MVQLYRTISKEMPRVLTIYDADLSPQDVRGVVLCAGLIGGRSVVFTSV